ncbi:MAG: FAD-binding protein [Actinomycetota bacterium]
MTAPPASISHRSDRPWSNWGRTSSCRPGHSFFPRRVEDLVEIVRFARERGLGVRPVGSGHSWSPLVTTDDVLVYVQNLNDVAVDLSDDEHPRVVVGSGATNREVNAVLERHGYALPLNVVLESVRFGGLVATGSHGSGRDNQTISDLVHAIDLVTATGRLRRYEAGVDDEDVMNAVRLNLGMFGLMSAITLDVQKSWNVRARDIKVPVAEVFDKVDELVLSHENLDLFWFPFSERFWVKSWDRVDAPAEQKPRASRVDRVGGAVRTRMWRAMLGVTATAPRLTPFVCRVGAAAAPKVRDDVVEIVEAIHYSRGIEIVRTGCVEMAFKIDPSFDAVRTAIKTVMDAVKTEAETGRYPLNVCMNVRFICNSDCLLSPASGEGRTCYIEILGCSPPEGWRRFSAAIGREWLDLPHARPHWAKEWRHIPRILEHIESELGDDVRRFDRIKDHERVDPDGMFLNATLREVF